jgi:hypothetical protein
MAIANRRIQSGRRNAVSHANGLTLGDSNGYCYTDSHSNTYRYGDGHGYSYSYSYSNAQTDAHAEICANSEASSHTAAETVV